MPALRLRSLLQLALIVMPALSAADTPLSLAAHFGEHMVLQREQPLRLWGRGPAGQTLQLMLAGQQVQTQVQADGRWQVQLPALPAGGPHVLRVTAAQHTLQVPDVLLGDVWLCGGQSNMAWPLAQAQDGAREVATSDAPTLRHLRVPNRAALLPAEDIAPAPWVVARPGATAEFSAVAYHFARYLQARSPGVPIGLINTAWNGSNLEAWVRRDLALADADLAPTLRAVPTELASYLDNQRRHLHDVVQRFQPGLPVDTAGGGVNAGADTRVDTRTWHLPAFDHGAWPTLQAPLLWEAQGLPGLDGVVWYRRTVTLSAAQAAGAAVLHLARIDDCDESFVNGQRVGGICHYDTPRRYPLPAGLLHEGSNTIAVRVTDLGGGGGFHGDAGDLRLDTAAGSLPLAGRWSARVATVQVPGEPQANDAPSLAHNGLVHPLRGLGLKGVLWYQGESNVARAAAYAPAFQQLITDWRRQFEQPALPFLFVQLAAFLPLQNNTLEASAWAELRDAQRQALALPHTGMVVATDVGDADDIHPRDKRSVGERLARLALREFDATQPDARGPVLRRVERDGATLRLHFEPGHGLAARPAGAALQGFAIADASRRFRPALARIEGGSVRVWHADIDAPVAVRYGWVDNPSLANLVDGQGLPASPLRSDDWPLATAGQRYAP